MLFKPQIVTEQSKAKSKIQRKLASGGFQAELKKQKLNHYRKNCNKKLIAAVSTVIRPLLLNTKSEKQNLNKIKKLCPSIQNTCCHYDELVYLFNDVEYGFDTFLRWNFNQIQRFQNTMDKIQDQMIDDYINENHSQLEQCLFSKNPWDFKEIFLEIKDMNKDIKTMYVEYAKEAFLDQYRLQCAICDQKYNKYFKMYDRKNSEQYSIKVDARKEMPYIFEIWNKGNFIRRLRLIGKIMNCVINQESSQFKGREIIFDDTMQKLIEEKNTIAIFDNHKYQKYFKSNYLTGGVQDIFFQRFSKLLEQYILRNGSVATNRRISTKWIPLEINEPQNAEYSTKNVNIQMDFSSGYYSKDISLGQSSYIKEIYRILNIGNYNDEEEEESTFINIFGNIILLFIVLIN